MKKRFIAIISIICMCVLAFTACSASSPDTAASSAAISEEAPAMAAQETGGYSNEYSASDAEYYAEDTTPGEDAAPEAESSSSGEGFSVSTANIPETNRKLVYQATFVIDTTNYQQDYNLILSKLAECNGYVEYESTQGTAPDATTYEGRYSNLTVRVPVENFDTFFTGVSGVGKVVQQTRSTEDISANYYDTESRIELLEARRDRLMGYLEAATKPADIIAYESELSDVLYELDQLQGSRRHMDDLVDYTTVDITIYETVIAADVPVDENGMPVGDRANDAFSKSMSGVGQFLEDFAVGFAAAAPVLLLLAAIAIATLLIIKLVRYLRKKYGKEKPKRQPQMQWQQPGFPPPQQPGMQQGPAAQQKPPVPPQDKNQR